ncbi:MAG TPA: hypothetical protein VIV11_02535 [Kofleriaceae bacterium]
MKRALVVVLVVAACGGNDGPSKIVDANTGGVDAKEFMDAKVFTDAKVFMDAKVFTDAPLPIVDAPMGVCNPLTQTGCAVGEKCTWLMDAMTPQYIGHIGCAPNGTGMVGDACMYGAPGPTGYDACARGLVCGNYRGGAGVCKTICDNQGGNPMCGSANVCVTYSGLFGSAPALAGVCDPRCDPLADNDYDGSGALTKTGTVCGTSGTTGCYGYPSFGTPPVTGWSCTNDIHSTLLQPTGLRHRVRCTVANGCADPGPTVYVNSCNQGYLPLLRESTTVTEVICVALCKPKNCYLGNCGTAAADRLGTAPHRCNTTDRVGTLDNSPAAEHCAFMWLFETDGNGNFLRSPTSDTVGFCYDHSKYLYDSDGNNTPDAPLPACAQLMNGFGSGTNPADPLTYYGAADLGCVDTTNAGLMFAGKSRPPRLGVRPLYGAARAP